MKQNAFLPDGKINLLELEFFEFEKWIIEALGLSAFRAVQIWQWLWQKQAANFDEMTNISLKTRDMLNEKASIILPKIEMQTESSDGVQKFLIKASDGALFETVLIPAINRSGQIRWSQCLSTQIGCPMNCSFCATGKAGFKRNMTMGEILSQVLIGKKVLNDTRPDKPVLRNLVFMGMGEPLLNLSSLLPALKTLSLDKGANFSPRRMTVSTCGIEKGLKILGESGLAYLAVSLHAPSQKLREQIMPKAARWHLEDMFSALAEYPLKTRERITFEYLLLGGINDSLEHAKDLVRLAGRVRGKINLIPYNTVAGLDYKKPAPERVEAFQEYLCRHNFTAILRKSRGGDIGAACGQLAAEKPDCLSSLETQFAKKAES